VALAVDSFRPRGVSALCELKDRPIQPWRERTADAYAALDHLVARPGVDPAQVLVLGRSHGGSTVMGVVRPEARGRRPDGPRFRAAIAFYPGCEGPLRQRGYRTTMPLLILHGGADDWAPPGPCVELAQKLTGGPFPVTAIVYPGAYHGFDDPGARLRWLPNVYNPRMPGERGAHVGGDEPSRLRAIDDAHRFIEEHRPGQLLPEDLTSGISDRIVSSYRKSCRIEPVRLRGCSRMRPRGGKRPAEWNDIKRAYLAELRDRTGVELSLDRTNARWASGPAGAVAIVIAEERPEGDRWFMGLDPTALDARQPRGVILLCEEASRHLVVLGFGASRWAELVPRMSRGSGRGELKFDVRRRGHRYVLAGLDVTSAVGDVSWLTDARPGKATQPEPVDAAPETGPDTPAHARHVFFARVRGACLEPLDPTGLAEGELVLVSARLVRVVPTNAGLRRLIAAGGPPSLPRDFAERHDTYAHGTSAS
jgi:dienelactone hydrolase